MAIDVAHYRFRDRLINGGSVVIRAITPHDKRALRDTFHRLSPRSVYLRFFTDKHDLTEAELAYLTELDFVRRVGLVVVINEGQDKQIIGVGRYATLGDQRPWQRADLAIAVEDSFQGLGVGTLLLRHLARIARWSAIAVFEADLLPDNDKMLEVFANSGFPVQTRVQSGMVHVTLSLREPPT
jgi:GNAT superfamily N-acetyltransferase